MNIEVKNSVKPVDYNKSIEILERRVKEILLGKKNELLWILEHNTVYTAGASSQNKDLIDKSLKVIKTKRGGKHTLHSKGQKVIYFVLDLNKRGKDIRQFVKKIENCIMDILKEFNVNSYTDKKNIGIWVNEKNSSKKIAAIGIKVKRWIAYHGFSLNISNDLSLYKGIVPCGIRDKDITSLEEIGITKHANISNVIIKNFLNTFP